MIQVVFEISYWFWSIPLKDYAQIQQIDNLIIQSNLDNILTGKSQWLEYITEIYEVW